MKVTIVPIVIGGFGTVTKGLLKGLEDLEVGRRLETIQTTALLRTVEMIAGGEALLEVKIQRDISQGDFLSPLLFLIINDVTQFHTSEVDLEPQMVQIARKV